MSNAVRGWAGQSKSSRQWMAGCIILISIVVGSFLLYLGNGYMRVWGLKRLESRAATRSEVLEFMGQSVIGSVPDEELTYNGSDPFKKKWDRMDLFVWYDGLNPAPCRVYVSYNDDRVSEIRRRGL